MAYGDRWFGEKKSGAEKSIAKWEKWYKDDPEFLRKLVEHSLKDTHSPGRKAAFQGWLDASVCHFCNELKIREVGKLNGVPCCEGCAEYEGE